MATKAMILRLDSGQAAELEAVARIEGLPMSEVVRAAIDEHIARRCGDEGFQRRLQDGDAEDQRALEPRLGRA